jgi:cellulose synthase/poly-beta-1,6-N-acetylglucosamine synthase-like glycosyltransferase
MVAMLIIFWLCLGVVLWEILLFPAALALFSRLRRKPLITAEITPALSIIIATHNEAAHIAEKLENTLALDYPKDRLEIIVADDGSEDNTAAIVQGFTGRGVQLIRQEWQGKTAAQNLAAIAARGEIILFSDATALYNPIALKALMRPFADPQVGCVTGQVKLGEAAFQSDRATAAGLKGRLQYEQGVRKAQGEAFSLFGASGCIYAVRKSLYQPLPEDQVSDLVLPLLLLRQGYRTVYAPEAVATLERAVSAEKEFHRRSRIVLQCLRAMGYMRGLFVPRPGRAFIAAIAWYRLLRWLLPIFLLGLLISNIILVGTGPTIYWWPLALQFVGYSLGILAKIIPGLAKNFPPAGMLFVFLWINLAALAALARLLAGEKGVTWPTARGR